MEQRSDLESLLDRHFGGRRLKDLSEFELDKLLYIRRMYEGSRRPPSLPSFPEDGLSARQALDTLKSHQAACERLFPGSAIDSHPLYSALFYGYYHATGYRVPVRPDLRAKRIPPYLWKVLRIDADANRATGDGLTYSGLTFYETKPEPKHTVRAEVECGRWLAEKMQSPKETTVEKLFREAEQKFSGLSYRAFKRAVPRAKVANTTHPSWKKPGPPSQSS